MTGKVIEAHARHLKKADISWPTPKPQSKYSHRSSTLAVPPDTSESDLSDNDALVPGYNSSHCYTTDSDDTSQLSDVSQASSSQQMPGVAHTQSQDDVQDAVSHSTEPSSNIGQSGGSKTPVISQSPPHKSAKDVGQSQPQPSVRPKTRKKKVYLPSRSPVRTRSRSVFERQRSRSSSRSRSKSPRRSRSKSPRYRLRSTVPEVESQRMGSTHTSTNIEIDPVTDSRERTQSDRKSESDSDSVFANLINVKSEKSDKILKLLQSIHDLMH